MSVKFGVCAVVLAAGVASGLGAPGPRSAAFFGDELGENTAIDWAPCAVPDDRDTRGTLDDSLWPGGVVPYAFNSNVSLTNQNRARAAMDEIEAVSDVQFVPRTSESAYVLFNASSSSNSSPVGYGGGVNNVQIVSWSWRFIICHELMHSLGIYHEQQRPGRNNYVEIHWDHIQSGYENNFTVASRTAGFGPYDFESVMHYGPCSFSTCSCSSCPTITVQSEYASMQGVIGQRSYLSDGDAGSIAFMYNGPSVGEDALEPNDDPEHAAPIAPGSHELVMGDEADCFSFTLAETSDVSVHASCEENGWAATVQVLDGSGAVLASGENGMFNDGDPVDVRLAPGAYVVRIGQVFGFHPYVLSLSATAAPGCDADLNGDGAVNLDDLDAFVAAFLAGSPGADLNGDGSTNLDDLDAFIAAYLAGCP